MMAWGHWDCIPAFRRRPEFAVAVVGDVEPPYFTALVAQADATRLPAIRAREGHCFFYDVGSAAPVYVPWAVAKCRIQLFTEVMRLQGEALSKVRCGELALLYFEQAAAISGCAADYERMLQCPMPERRRRRVSALRDDAIQRHASDVE